MGPQNVRVGAVPLLGKLQVLGYRKTDNRPLLYGSDLEPGL